jgi:hypothetical protein
MEELFFRKKKLFKKNSHVYITKYKITDLFFFSRRFIDHLFINKRVPVVEYVDCSWLKIDKYLYPIPSPNSLVKCIYSCKISEKKRECAMVIGAHALTEINIDCAQSNQICLDNVENIAHD